MFIYRKLPKESHRFLFLSIKKPPMQVASEALFMCAKTARFFIYPQSILKASLLQRTCVPNQLGIVVNGSVGGENSCVGDVLKGHSVPSFSVAVN